MFLAFVRISSTLAAHVGPATKPFSETKVEASTQQERMQDLAAQKRILSMAKDARQQRLAWRSMDAGMSQAYKQAGFKLPLSV